MKIQFQKYGDMKYISHLDLIRLFQRAARRADLPVFVTKGFSPHLKISIKRALKLGIESDNEEACFYLDEYVSPFVFEDRLNQQLPGGVRVLNAEII